MTSERFEDIFETIPTCAFYTEKDQGSLVSFSEDFDYNLHEKNLYPKIGEVKRLGKTFIFYKINDEPVKANF